MLLIRGNRLSENTIISVMFVFLYIDFKFTKYRFNKKIKKKLCALSENVFLPPFKKKYFLYYFQCQVNLCYLPCEQYIYCI